MISIKVDLSNLNLDKDKKAIAKGLVKGLKKSALLLERDIKKTSKVRTGRYRSSVKAVIRGLTARIGPHVIYSDWVERGRKGKHIPRTHKKSSFTGHHTVEKSAKKNENKIIRIIKAEIGRAV